MRVRSAVCSPSCWLTDARCAARTTADGSLVPLAEQERDLWNVDQVAEGTALVARTLGAGPIGPYQVQAAITAVHDEAKSAEATDWPQILALYEVLERVSPGPVVTLNRAVDVAMVDGPRAGLALLGTLDGDERMAHNHRLEAVRAISWSWRGTCLRPATAISGPQG